MIRHIRFATMAFAAFLAASVSVACAAEPSFGGKQISVYVSSSPGGGLDLYARTFARHMPDFLPGKPVMVPKNMPGAGGLQLANQLANQLPRDGTAVAAVTNGLTLSQLLDTTGNAHYDAATYNWVGRISDLPLLLVTWNTSKVKNATDMMTTEFAVSDTGPGSYGFLVLSAVKNVLGAKMKIVSGYTSGGANRLAVERGEVDGTASIQWTVESQHDWIVNNHMNILVQIAGTKYANLPNVPLLADLAKDEETRHVLNLFVAPADIGRGITLPPGVSADVVALYRTAFMAMMKDPSFLEDCKKQTLDVNPLDGAALQKVVIASSKASPSEIARAKAAVAIEPGADKKKGK
jgi:tripartite-type tricarboxylate transporter receptor subunit TctC